MTDVDRAVVDRTTAGFLKLVCDKRGRILGAHALCANASTLIETLVLARKKKMTVVAARVTRLAVSVARRRAAESGLALLPGRGERMARIGGQVDREAVAVNDAVSRNGIGNRIARILQREAT